VPTLHDGEHDDHINHPHYGDVCMTKGWKKPMTEAIPVGKDDDCGTCGHPFALHALVATKDSPMNGGIVLCPVKDCPCYATWGVGRASQRPDAPSQDEIDRLRMAVQMGEHT
jgi:hypothetical protein